MSATKTRSRVGSIIAVTLTVVFMATAAWLFLNRQFVLDQFTNWSYQPSAQVATITDTVRFSDKGRFLFYATRPEVADANQFNQDCPRQEPGSAILGCYNADRIFIYDISNQQLDGIKEVTAAHEMLHAAWARLSVSEQERLTVLLEAEYEKHSGDELEVRMEYYQRNEPDQLINELHSILPTEVRTLSPELEAYYRQYFNDRSHIVDLFDDYNGVFKDLKAKGDGLFLQLERLAAAIESSRVQYEQQSQQLATDIDTFNGRATGGGFSSRQQFDAERSALVTRSTELERQRVAISGNIEQYNTLYDEYQKVATDLDSLSSSIDSIPDINRAPTITE